MYNPMSTPLKDRVLSEIELSVIQGLYNNHRAVGMTEETAVNLVRLFGKYIPYDAILNVVENDYLFTRICTMRGIKFTRFDDAIKEFKAVCDTGKLLLFFVELGLFVICTTSDYGMFMGSYTRHLPVDNPPRDTLNQIVMGHQPQKLVFFAQHRHLESIEVVVKRILGCKLTTHAERDHQILTVEHICKDYNETDTLYRAISASIDSSIAKYGMWKDIPPVVGNDIVLTHLIGVMKDLKEMKDEVSRALFFKTGNYVGDINVNYFDHCANVIINNNAGDVVINPPVTKSNPPVDWMRDNPPSYQEFKNQYYVRAKANFPDLNNTSFGLALKKAGYVSTKWKRKKDENGKMNESYVPA